MGWWPIRTVKVFVQAGPLFDELGTAVQARVGVGYNLRIFMIAVMPYFYVQTTDAARGSEHGDTEPDLRGFTWSIGARVQY
jgi:hypothetical protein